MRLTIVGTGHVFRIGEIVAEIIRRRRPHVVCVELDPVRLGGLQERARLNAYEEAGDPRAEAMRRQHEEATKRMPRLYRFLARLQERLADQEGVEAGSEMLAAVDAAGELDVPVATIDVDAQRLIRRAWREMRWRERIRFVWAVLRGRKGDDVESELKDYQDDPVAYLARVGDEFPSLKRVLIDERDEHMAKRILQLEKTGVTGVQEIAQAQRQARKQSLDEPRAQDDDPAAPGAPAGEDGNEQEELEEQEVQEAQEEQEEELVVVAVVGDGHIPGMLTILERALPDQRIETIRVGDLRAGRIPETDVAEADGSEQSGDAESVRLRYDVTAVDSPEQEPPGV